MARTFRVSVNEVNAAPVLDAIPDATLDELKNALKEMEKAAAIIGQAMLRP